MSRNIAGHFYLPEVFVFFLYLSFLYFVFVFCFVCIDSPPLSRGSVLRRNQQAAQQTGVCPARQCGDELSDVALRKIVAGR